MTTKTMITGFPRMGENRELKNALENYWSGKTTFDELENVARDLRKKHWLEQRNRGINLISSNDFSYYDSMLDTAVMLNIIPERFRDIKDDAKRYFSMARGTESSVAMEMTKWFNTNYHYIVPELDDRIMFHLNAEKLIREYREALELGIQTKINIIGPITFTGLSKTTDGKDPFTYFDRILSVYKELVIQLEKLSDSVVLQFDEPLLVRSSGGKHISMVAKTYDELSRISKNIKIIVNTYFEHACETVEALADTPIWGIGLDFVHGDKNLNSLDFVRNKMLIAGIVDGRNIWINDFDRSIKTLRRIAEKVPKEQIIISTSCSLLHVPYSLKGEPENNVQPWMSFAVEKVDEVAFIGRVFHEDHTSEEDQKILLQNSRVLWEKKNSSLLFDQKVFDRIKNLHVSVREGSFNERIKIQQEKLKLPPLPTTTIGSFPQTPEIRKVRMDFKKNRISHKEYESKIKAYIDDCVSFQESVGLDVLVHGEPERNDMVEYFGELLNGFHFTKNGWVQSYGSRCVKPPIIYGDISRPEPMTVKWISYAQSRTSKIMKGMLTGPVTIINWSFVRDDIPRSVIATQIALALADEISDLQNAGIKIIQVDEAAFKEGYPLRKEKIAEYEKWAVDSFKLSASLAKQETQIHTHMCYSEFNEIIKKIEEMDADVITIETARSGNRLLKIFHDTDYKNEIGPGVYDIHSPRIPSIDEFKEQIRERLQVVDKSGMWVNPDCGLKTRKWEEVKPALRNMVQATLELR